MIPRLFAVLKSDFFRKKGRKRNAALYDYKLFHNLIRNQGRYLALWFALVDKVAGGIHHATRRSDADRQAVGKDRTLAASVAQEQAWRSSLGR